MSKEPPSEATMIDVTSDFGPSARLAKRLLSAPENLYTYFLHLLRECFTCGVSAPRGVQDGRQTAPGP